MWTTPIIVEGSLVIPETGSSPSGLQVELWLHDAEEAELWGAAWSGNDGEVRFELPTSLLESGDNWIGAELRVVVRDQVVARELFELSAESGDRRVELEVPRVSQAERQDDDDDEDDDEVWTQPISTESVATSS